MSEEHIRPKKRDDWREVRNYILREITGQQRGRVYAFKRYLKLFVS